MTRATGVLVRSCGSSCAWDSAPKLVTSVRRSVPTARHASSVEGVRRARPLHGHGPSRADHPRRTVQLGAAISALEWAAHVTHSPRFDERLMLLRLASSNTCPAECSCSMHAARSEWIIHILDHIDPPSDRLVSARAGWCCGPRAVRAPVVRRRVSDSAKNSPVVPRAPWPSDAES